MYEGNTLDGILAAQREAEKEWERQAKTDNLLMEGIRNRLTWEQYSSASGCPGHLKDRYFALQRNSGILPTSEAEKRERELFLKGFMDE